MPRCARAVVLLATLWTLPPLRAADPPLVRDETRARLDLAGTWEVQPVAGLDLKYPPADAGWHDEREPQPASRYIDSPNGPYMPAIGDLLTKDGTAIAKKTGLAAWFRRRFTLDAADLAGGRVVLVLKGAAFRSDTWLNGHELGTSVQCAVPIEYDVTGALKPGENELLVGLTAREGLVDIAHKCFVAPCNGMMAGLYGGIELDWRPATAIDDVFVRTSVEPRHLDLDVTVVNTAGAPLAGQLEAVVVDRDGAPQLTLAPATVTVPVGGTSTVTLSAELGKEWLQARLWQPTSPQLFTARVSLRGGPALLDRVTQRFGFRQFEIKSRDFLLNGERVVLFRNSTLMAMGDNPHAFPEVRDTVTRPYNCVRLHIGQDNGPELDACDQFGMMAIPESAWSWTDRYPTAAKDVWLPNTLEFYRRWVRRNRNRPAIILWSLCNETYWDSVKPEDMACAEQILAVVRANDPTRPQQGDGEVNWGGRLPTINVHYPEGEAGDVRRECPNSGIVVPNDLWWLKKDGLNASWRAGFIWDRPLMFGEYWNPGGSPDDQCSYAGDRNYDWEYWRHAPSAVPGADLWMPTLQKATDYYRLAGVACLNPWYGDRAAVIKALDVRPMDYHPNWFGGQTAVRKVAVFNDTRPDQTWYEFGGMHLDCCLAAADRALWSREVKASVWPGTSKAIDISVACPPVTVQTPARLTVRLVDGRGVELARFEETIYLLPSPTLAGLDTAGALLLDADGRTQQALAGLGANLTAVKVLTTEALAKAKLLIIGEETDASPYAEAIRPWVAEGGRVLLLRQESPRTLAGELPDADKDHSASMAWVRAPHHPLLAGLDEAQFRWWRPDHLVSRHTYHKPASGRFQVLLDCGGRYGMAWTPLAEIGVGKGFYLVSQLCLADRVEVEPLAGELLARLLRYGLSAAPPPARPLRLLAGANQALQRTLAVCGVVTRPGLAGDGPVLVDGSQTLAPADLAALGAELQQGGTVWLHRFTPEALAKVAGLLPFKPELTAYDNTTQTGAIRPNHAWADGLGTFDLYWSRVELGGRDDAFRHGQATAKLGDYTLVAPTPDLAQPLCAPAFLARLPAGRGAVLLDELDWEEAYGAESAKVARLVSTLTTNLGGEVRLATEQEWSYFPVDLSAHVNRGYYSPAAGDGQGWTDQGANDMRFFLINHSGREGGLPTGMEVAVEPWPAEVRLAGRPFHLVDPTKGARKGVVALRGADHGPNLPSQVTGIKVGRKAERLWFLHTACWAIDDQLHAELGRYVIHYENGSTATVPLRYGQELQDWWNPAPLPSSQVAWTGRNLMHAPIGLWVTPWENPSPDQPIASIDLVGNLTQAQIVLLGITGGVSAGGPPERLAALWRLADAADGKVANQVPGGPPLTLGKPAPTPYRAEGHAGLHFEHGHNVTADTHKLPALTHGGPFSLEMSLMVEQPPPGYMGGLFQAARYGTAGFRLVYYQNLKLGVEIFPPGGKPAYLVGQTALTPGRFYRVKLVFDGQRAQLLLDGKLDASIDTAPPAPCDAGLQIGVAAGNRYELVGVVEEVAIRAPAGG